MRLDTDTFANVLTHIGAAHTEDLEVRRHLDSLVSFIRANGEPGINASLAFAWADGYEAGSDSLRQTRQINEIIRLAIERTAQRR